MLKKRKLERKRIPASPRKKIVFIIPKWVFKQIAFLIYLLQGDKDGDK